ncbi:glycosyltransferase [Methylobacterium sp. WL30]|uniref:glycosyltransferase n=2 Tax=Methylobacterium TaxID=407 RepID=UPI0011C8FA99|nr:MULTISPECIES: glycosyltransferase family 2 protein [unclassified Methylobacterium]MCJ2110081.1 glycosyltransferase [Methylobacterium sp. E-025]TXM92070.1 glycosyltransferase [Methylobacterium sp. WL116]TXN52100.1 glycosyltransferase [Methylobacterium sp. WL119]TXN70425.1 glycosyltransferase [Methylobacterium sp. WL30]
MPDTVVLDAIAPTTPAAGGPDTVVAIPVRNEAERIGFCLDALDAQQGLAPGRLGIVLFLNNCTDDTARIVAELVPRLSVPVRVIEMEYAGAHAGWARRKAMDAAAGWLGGAGTILSTDADSRVPPDWVFANLRALAAGADAVAGRVELIPEEAALLPPSLPARGRLEDAYSALLTEAEARIDPDPNDPWPCHRTTIGATLAVSRDAYARVGGMPEIALGEDGAFVARLLAHGFRVRHDPAVMVFISARLTGRAPGGVADTIRSRCEDPGALCDARLEPVPRALHRYLWRRRLRRLHASGRLGASTAWARRLGIPADEAARIAALPLVGQVVAEAERASPKLKHAPLSVPRLPGQIRLAKAVLPVVRAFASVRDRWEGPVAVAASTSAGAVTRAMP